MKKNILFIVFSVLPLYGGTISLQAGWNLVGTNEDISNVSVTFPNANAIWKYSLQEWEVMSPNNSLVVALQYEGLYNNSFSLAGGEGFWVHNTTNETITLSSENSTLVNLTTSIESSGWKLLSSTVNNQIYAGDIFDNSNIQTVWKYNDATWKVYSPDSSIQAQLTQASIETFQIISPNEGFWVNTSGSVTLDFNNTDTIVHNGNLYETVVSPYTGKTWLDRNLGASSVCTAVDDQSCYGDYYQWGRETDGHENKTSSSVDTIATNILNLEHGSFIKSMIYSQSGDWTSGDSEGVLRAANWSSTLGDSICPVNFRIPTESELQVEIKNITNESEQLNNFLKVPTSGSRNVFSADIGSGGGLWSITYELTNNEVFPRYYRINNHPSAYAYFSGTNAGYGFSVRCIKD